MRMRPHRTVVAALGAALAAGCVAAPAAAEVPTLEGPNVVWYEQDVQFASSTLRIRDGERTPGGGCLISGRNVLPPGQEAIVEVELAYDPDSCRSLTRVGVPAERTASGGADGGETASDTSGGTFGAGATAPASTYGRWTATASSYYEDPPQLDVNKVTNIIEWEPDGSCAVAVNPYGAWSETTWRTGTGWSQEQKSHYHNATCSSVWSETWAKFKNTLFCIPWEDTFTWYQPNRVEGRPDTSAVHRWNAWKAGDCADLLTFQHELSRSRKF